MNKFVSGLIYLACLLLVIVTSLPTFAAERPDAGKLLEELKEPPTLPKEQKPVIEIEEEKSPPPSPATVQDGVKVAIRGIRFTGNTVFSEKELLAVVVSYAGRELSFSDMKKAAAEITNYYRKRGYILARAYLPTQEVKDGIVQIAVIEGRLGKLEVIRDKDARMSESTLKWLLSGAVSEGGIVREDRIERGTYVINDIPGAEVRSTLRPGATVGTTDLILEMKEKFPISAHIDGDNYGNRYTGYYRGGVTVSENNFAGIGETFNIRIMASEGELYERAAFTVPASIWGTRIGASFSNMDYKLGRDFSSLDAKGNAQVASIYLIHPFVRLRVFNLYAHLQYDYKTLDDRVDSTSTQTKKGVNSGTFALSMNARDGFLGGGASEFTLTGVAGNLDIKSRDARDIDASTARTNGAFVKGAVNISRLQRLIGDLSFYAAFTGQLASKNLDSSEKFSLGGPNGVRSYPQGEAVGDNGYIATGELRYLLPKLVPGSVQLSAFSDTGMVWINQDPWVGAGFNNTRNLHGAGVGLSWHIKHLYLNMSYAWKLGHEKSTSDIDRSGRFWIQATAWF